jgi:hypothetical protein
MHIKALPLTLTLSLGLGVATAAQADTLALGAAAPQTSVKMKCAVTKKKVSLADAKGKNGSLVVFTCNNCPYSVAWEERIVALGHEYAKQGIGTILVNSNDPSIAKTDTYALMQQRAKERGMKMSYVVDEKSAVARAFGASKTPEVFLFSKDKKLVYHGAIDANHKDADNPEKRYLKDAIDAVVQGKAPPMAETKALGCGIKFGETS